MIDCAAILTQEPFSYESKYEKIESKNHPEAEVPKIMMSVSVTKEKRVAHRTGFQIRRSPSC